MNLIAYGVGTQMQYVMVASAGQSDIIMQHAAGGEICQILMSRMEKTGAPAAAAGEEIKSRNQIGLVVITIQRMMLDFSVHQVRTAEWIKQYKCSVD